MMPNKMDRADGLSWSVSVRAARCTANMINANVPFFIIALIRQRYYFPEIHSKSLEAMCLLR